METKVKKIEKEGYNKKIQFIGELVEVSPIGTGKFFRIDFIDRTFFFAIDAGRFVWRKGMLCIITAEKTADERMYQPESR